MLGSEAPRKRELRLHLRKGLEFIIQSTFIQSYWNSSLVPALVSVTVRLVLLFPHVRELDTAVQGHFVRALPFRFVAVPKQPLLLLSLVKAVVLHGVDVRLLNRGFEALAQSRPARVRLVERPHVLDVKRLV